MAESNQLSDFTGYIENLCVSHVVIKHVKDDEDHQHFIELNDDQKIHDLKHICFPFVAMDKLTINYTGQNDGMNKNRYVELMFLDKVSDPGDYAGIQTAKNAMERIAEDFIKKFKVDRKDRATNPFLKCLVLSNISVDLVENKAESTYGALLSFNFELPFNETLETGRFI